MDLFGKKLSFQETFQLDSLIDNGHYDPHLILLTTMMNNPDYVPSSEQSKQIMEHIQNGNSGQTPTTVDKIEQTEQKSNVDNIEKKKHSKTYIKLPNATIKLHKHKFEQPKNEGNSKPQS
jgi:hypothetical protein